MFRVAISWIRNAVRSERGQDLIEYALLSGLVALAIIAVGIVSLTGAIDAMMAGIGQCLDFDGLNCT